MMTAGIGADQFFWCNLCCAYTGERARKLTKQCDRKTRTVPAVVKLRNGVHPHTGTMLTVRPRRMLIGDVGELPPTFVAAPSTSTTAHDNVDHGVAECADLTKVEALVLPSLSAFSDDPLEDCCC